eukprot:236151-Amphidinium_carterae.2
MVILVVVAACRTGKGSCIAILRYILGCSSIVVSITCAAACLACWASNVLLLRRSEMIASTRLWMTWSMR